MTANASQFPRPQPSDSAAPPSRHLDAVRIVFDEWVRTGIASGMERRHKRLAELMTDRIAFPPDARVLDVGCGLGWTARMLAERIPAGAFVGIDLSFEMIIAARRACRGIENALFAPAPAEEIPWAEDYFTHIISIESAYYWEKVTSACSEIYRVCAYGGSFHILLNYFDGNPYSEGWDTDMRLSLHRMSAEEWASWFRRAGFHDVATETIPDDSPIPPGKPPDELARRRGLQRIGALYVTGKKPSIPKPPRSAPKSFGNPFRVLR